MSVATALPIAGSLPKTSGCCSSKAPSTTNTPSSPVESSTESSVSPKPKTCCAGKKRKIDEVSPEPLLEKSAKRKPQGVVVDGQTYTCAACRSGHRVGLCKHALERPMMPTNPPGRPAAGTKKSGQCDCPKNCNCKKNNCKCPRECACTQEMYLMVYVPDTDEGRDGDDVKEGIWKLGQRVMTDLKGNTLSDEEVARRQAKKQEQKCCKGGKTKHQSPTMSQVAPSLESQQPDVMLPSMVQSSVSTPQPILHEIQPLADHHCSCGAACACAFCPQHPNNSVSKGLVRQQAMVSSQQQFPNSQDFFHLDAASVSFSPDRSCMGFKPSFAIGHYPMRPGANDFQRAFPAAAGGYMLAYPMWEIEAMQASALEHHTIPVPQQEQAPPQPDWTQNTAIFDDNPLFDQSQNSMEVGNAFIARNDLGSWNEPFDMLDPSQLAFTEQPSLSAFDASIPMEAAHVPPLSHSTSSSSTNITALATPDPVMAYTTADVHGSDQNWFDHNFDLVDSAPYI